MTRAVIQLLTLLLLLPLLSSCGLLTKDPVPVRDDPDLKLVPDAVPRKESKSRYGNPESYVVRGKRYHTLDSSEGFKERGTASWYGRKFHGRRTSSGETYDMYKMTAAHKTLPLPTYVEVSRVDDGRSVVVRVNDRGPFIGDRVIDLSYAAAERLGMSTSGTAEVVIRAISGNTGSGSKAKARPGVATARQDSTVVTSDSSSSSRRLYIQLGAFREKVRADDFAREIDRLDIGRTTRITPISLEEVGILHKVQLGPFADRTTAAATMDKLLQYGYEGFLVPVAN